MVGWHHRHNGYGFGWTLGVGDGQGGLACCSSWGRKELDTTESLKWTENRQEWQIAFSFLAQRIYCLQDLLLRVWASEWKKESEVIQSCPTLCNPTDCNLPGSSDHGIFQARVLEWVAIAFSKNIHRNYLITKLHGLLNILTAIMTGHSFYSLPDDLL